MGYRSEVVLALKPKAAILLSTVRAGGGAIASLLTEDASDVTREEDGSVIYRWGGIKWYDSYPEIAAIENFMSRLEEEDMEEDYRFVRVGEDMDDNEVRGYGFEVGIARSIEWW